MAETVAKVVLVSQQAHRSPTAKRKRAEHSTDGEAAVPAPATSSGSNAEDPPAKKQLKNPTTSTGKSID